MSAPDKREQLLALMILDDRTGAKVSEVDDNWVVMLTGPRFGGQYMHIGRFVLDDIAIKAGAGISDHIPRVDLIQYYVGYASEWTIRVMLDDYMKDYLQVTL